MNSYTITDKCVGCTLCARNCPVQAISGTLKERHKIDAGLCIRCGLCGKLCGSGAIRDQYGKFATKLSKSEWKHPKIDASTCAGCSLCIENCPKNCLALTSPKFHGDIRTVAELVKPEDCIGCGLCEKACPIRSISLK